MPSELQFTEVKIDDETSISIRTDLYEEFKDTLFTENNLKVAVAIQGDFGAESKRLEQARLGDSKLEFSHDEDHIAIRKGDWRNNVHNAEIERLSQCGTTTLVHPGYNTSHGIHADNFVLDNEGKAHRITVEKPLHEQNHERVPHITDSEDAGSLDARESHKTIENTLELRNGGSRHERGAKKYAQVRQGPLSPEESGKAINRLDGLQSPEYGEDEIFITVKGNKQPPVRRMEWQAALQVAVGSQNILIPKLHTAEEFKHINRLFKRLEKEFNVQDQIQLDFLVEVGITPYQLQEALFYLGGGDVGEMKKANARGEQYVLPDGKLAHKCVFGAWDKKANDIFTSEPREKVKDEGNPKTDGAEDYMAWVADKRGFVTCGSMWVQLMSQDPNNKTDVHCIDGAKKQKTRDRMFMDTWVAQVNEWLFNTSNEIMRKEINREPVIALQAKFDELGQEGFEQHLDARFKEKDHQVLTKADFENYVELFYRFCLTYVKDHAHGCIANSYMNDLLNPDNEVPRDMHDPATGTERTRAVLWRCLKNNAVLQDGTVCDMDLLEATFDKVRKHNRLEILKDRDIAGKVEEFCREQILAKDPVEYCLIPLFELQREYERGHSPDRLPIQAGL